jgi:hypothetical protein
MQNGGTGNLPVFTPTRHSLTANLPRPGRYEYPVFPGAPAFAFVSSDRLLEFGVGSMTDAIVACQLPHIDSNSVLEHQARRRWHTKLVVYAQPSTQMVIGSFIGRFRLPAFRHYRQSREMVQHCEMKPRDGSSPR